MCALAILGIIPIFPQRDYGLEILNAQIANADIEEEVFDLTEEDTEVLEELSTEIDGQIDIAVMSEEEQQVFQTLVEQAVAALELPTEEDANDTTQEILNFFNSNTEIYGNLEELTQEVLSEIDENHSSIFDHISGEKVIAATRLISIKLLGTILNVAIGVIAGGAVSWFIRKYGWSVVVTQLASRVNARYQLRRFAALARGLTKTAVAIANPGKTIAEMIDRHDKIKRSGYLELY